jgi:hypothetical protein
MHSGLGGDLLGVVASSITEGPQTRSSGFQFSLVILVLWCLWKHHNACVFDGISPGVPRIIQEIKDDATLWCMAGAKGLSSIWP